MKSAREGGLNFSSSLWAWSASFCWIHSMDGPIPNTYSLWLSSRCVKHLHVFGFPQKTWLIEGICKCSIFYWRLRIQWEMAPSQPIKHRFKDKTLLLLKSPLAIFLYLGSCHLYWLSPFLFSLLHSPQILISFLQWANILFSLTPSRQITFSLSIIHSFIHSIKIKYYPLWGTVLGTSEDTRMDLTWILNAQSC